MAPPSTLVATAVGAPLAVEMEATGAAELAELSRLRDRCLPHR